MEPRRRDSVASAAAPPLLMPPDRPSDIPCDQVCPTCDVEMMALIPVQDKTNSKQTTNNSASTIVEELPALIRSAGSGVAGDNAASAVSHQSHLRSGGPSALSRLFLDSWVCETAALSFGIASLGAIAHIVGIHDGANIPRFISGLTLNTIVSVLSTAARSSLIFVTSAAVGLSKWRWFRRKHRLHNIQALDDASRGPLGGLSVLVSFTGGGLAALGSTVTISLVAFSPSLQQLIEYPLRNTTQPYAVALAPQVLAYIPFDWESHDLNRAIEVGKWSAPKPFDREPQCATGRCSWQKSHSVGWCSKCENLTDVANLANCELGAIVRNDTKFSKYCTLDLGDGLGISLLSQVPDKGAYGIVHVNYTREAIWPVSNGNIAKTQEQQDRYITDLSTILSMQNNNFFSGIRNPLMVFGHVVAEPTWGQTAGDSSAGVDLLHVTEASQCVLTLCDRYLSVYSVDSVTTWHEESINHAISSPRICLIQ